MKKEILYPVITAIIVGAIAFYGGMQYQKSKNLIEFPGGGRTGNFMMGGGQRGGGTGSQGRAGMTQGFRPVAGEIIAADDKSITVKMEDGSSKIVLISDTTTINKTDPGSKTDLSVGTKVGVFGADNNGTITAQNIQINPQVRNFNSSPSASPK